MQNQLFYNIPLPANPDNIRHYQRYIKFITSRPKRDLIKEGLHFNLHHVFPRALGGSDDESNLIKLTHREHYIAHMILWKCGYKEMVYAFWQIDNTNAENSVGLSSKEYARLRQNLSIQVENRWKNLSEEDYKLITNNMKLGWKNMDRIVYASFRKNISKKITDWWKNLSPEEKEIQVQKRTFPNIGRKNTIDTKELMSKSAINRWQQMSENEYLNIVNSMRESQLKYARERTQEEIDSQKESMRRVWKNKSQEQYLQECDRRRDTALNMWKNLSEEEYKAHVEAIKLGHQNRSEEEKQKTFQLKQIQKTEYWTSMSEEDYEIARKKVSGSNNGNAIPVICIDTGEYFGCKKDASIKIYGVNKFVSAITKSIQDKKPYKGYSWIEA